MQSNEINPGEQDDPKKKAGVIANSSGSIIRKNSGGQLTRSQLQKGSPETDAILDNANELWMGATPIGIVFDIKAGISGEDMSGEKLSPFWRIAGLFPFISEFRKTAKGVSVIGPRSTYREFAKRIGANFLDVTDEAWTMRKNVEFLQGVVKKGDDVIFSGKYNPDLLNPKSVLAQEIRYLQRHGYTWTDDFSRMIKK